MSKSLQSFQRNSWLRGSQPPTPRPPLSGDRVADWLVVGAGFTGVAVARRLANERPDDRIVLVDAKSMGNGSSTRSSGFVVSLGQFDNRADESARLYRIGKFGLSALRQQVETQGINCEWRERGRLIGARNVAGQRSLSQIEQTLGHLNSPFEIFDSDEVGELTGMKGYRFGVRQHESVLVNPCLLLQGLVDALPGNVEVYEGTKIERIESNRAITENGIVQFKHAFVTNNAMASELGFASHRVFPMRTFISSILLNQADQDRVGSEPEWGITSSERVGSSLRLVNGKILIRSAAYPGVQNRVSEMAELKKVAEIQSEAIRVRFPGSSFEVENTWSGMVGVSANGCQYFGRVSDNAFVSCGYNGHGIAQGTASGELLVELALKKNSRLLNDMLQLRRPSWIPRGKFLNACVRGYVSYLNWRFRDEI